MKLCLHLPDAREANSPLCHRLSATVSLYHRLSVTVLFPEFVQLETEAIGSVAKAHFCNSSPTGITFDLRPVERKDFTFSPLTLRKKKVAPHILFRMLLTSLGGVLS